DKTHLTVETLSGIRTLDLEVRGGKVRRAAVDMGRAEVGEDRSLSVDGQEWTGTPVSVGNPHFVLFVRDIEEAPLYTLGPRIEKHEAFPDGVNVEFVEARGENRLRMRVWERGSGVTMACGTGACASAAAAVRKGLCDPYEPVCVELDGGILEIRVDRGGTVTMTGPAESIYEGEAAV
ncbi:MAG: diaminopimelate epimerase, partial [Lachnospiraceae bacterium]|nr:diaminopimelate epimerase [Lachnospiraceae bacterium]